MATPLAAYLQVLRTSRRTPEGRPITKTWLANQLSTYLGRKVASSTIYRIESGEDMPGGDLLTALLDVLGGRFEDVQWLIKHHEATVEDGRRLALVGTLTQEEREKARALAASVPDNEVADVLARIEELRSDPTALARLNSRIAALIEEQAERQKPTS